jgi:histidinol-phosphate aminotransferase
MTAWHAPEPAHGNARMLAGLAHHGDADLVPGLIDLAVNVRSSGTPRWLAALIRDVNLAAYPDQRPAAAAIAARHHRTRSEVLLTAGAAEAFVLLARAMQPSNAVIVHPQFSEPEAAMRAAGHPVSRVVLPFPFLLAPELVPPEADLVFVGNPTNPHPSRTRGRRSSPCAGRAGPSLSMRHSPTACPASASQWRAIRISPGSSSSAA